MSSRTSSRSTFTMTPSTMSPSLKYLIVSSIAARKASSLPMSLTATCGVVAVVSVLLVMWERAPVRTVSRRYCYAGSPYHLCRSRTAREAPNPLGGRRLVNRGDIQQMRARPARSEARRLAAQLVAYGGSRARSMREGAHRGRNGSYPAQLVFPEARSAPGDIPWAREPYPQMPPGMYRVRRGEGKLQRRTR